MILEKSKQLHTSSRLLGRAFNHLEDLVFFYGSQGATEAVNHLIELSTPEGAATVRMKWDGNPQVYWGREKANGPLILATHNSWSKKIKTTTSAEIENFILNTGSVQNQNQLKERQIFAQQFSSLYDIFDAATPLDFIGFVYGDCLYTEQPTAINQVYSFSPNPKSSTTYHVNAVSKLGNRVGKSKVLAVGHAYYKTFGMNDHEQIAISSFEKFNKTNDLIVLDPIYNSSVISVNLSHISNLQHYIAKNQECVDEFLFPRKGLADLKDILYRYVNQAAKAKQLDSLGLEHFMSWLLQSSVSLSKQQKIKQLNQDYPQALPAIFKMVLDIQSIKDRIIEQLEKNHDEDIWDTNGEGRVRYADISKKFGNVKLVPRKRWTPQ